MAPVVDSISSLRLANRIARPGGEGMLQLQRPLLRERLFDFVTPSKPARIEAKLLAANAEDAGDAARRVSKFLQELEFHLRDVAARRFRTE